MDHGTAASWHVAGKPADHDCLHFIDMFRARWFVRATYFANERDGALCRANASTLSLTRG